MPKKEGALFIDGQVFKAQLGIVAWASTSWNYSSINEP